jgi:hypothetical protein
MPFQTADVQGAIAMQVVPSGVRATSVSENSPQTSDFGVGVGGTLTRGLFVPNPDQFC